ncbi:MAG: hypothetical protein V7776_18395 [Halopseudomonas aestusnigri]
MIVRTFVFFLMAFTLAACAQTKHRGSLSKYEKSVEFVESIITDASIEDGLYQALIEYKKENETASKRLSNEALDEINVLLTREMINNRIRLISKIAILLTAEFTDNEIVTLHSIKDIEALKSAHKKIKQNSGNTNVGSYLTQAEIKAIKSLKNVENFETLLPKFRSLEPKIKETGKEFSDEIIINVFPELLKIIIKYEPLVSASLFHQSQRPPNAYDSP